MKNSILFTPLAALSILGATVAFADGHGSKGHFTPAGEVEFQDIIPGVVAFGTVSGDRAKGAHGTFVRIPAGQATPPHVHGSAYEAVVIQGRFENPIEGNEASNVTLTAGSYYSVPANAKHITRCAADSEVDCISYFYQSTPFDFSVAE